MLAAAKSKHLDEDLRRLIAPVAAKPKVSNEPPQLRALAWLDNAEGGNAWKADGEPFHLSKLDLPPSLSTPTGVDVSETSAAASRPRFLCLWISQPAIDSLSVVKIELLDSAGKPLNPPSHHFATVAEQASPQKQNLGWITATICAGTMGFTPPRVTIRLNYSAGPWQYCGEFLPDMSGFTALATGVQLTPPGQGNDGMAFVQITRDTTADTKTEQWDFVAHTRDGGRLERRGCSQSESGQVRTERFRFDTPLSEIVRFEIRKRPIKMMAWNDVPLPTNTVNTLEIHADGSVTCGGRTWTAAQIKEKLGDWGRLDPQRPIVLRAAPDCPYSRVTEVLEACAAAKLSKVAFATNPP